ncbi:MAG: hypothetical protein KY444_09250 [Gemmatimonadetes bacterium]|nr:hypothetical protein [Gemmatimonadota bacterium]
MSPFHPAVRLDPSRLEWPRCEYRFPFRAFEAKISFERHLLPRWQELRARTVALLEGFVVAFPEAQQPISSP